MTQLEIEEGQRELAPDGDGHSPEALSHMELLVLKERLQKALDAQPQALAEGHSYAYSMGVLRGSIEVLIREVNAEIAARDRYMDEAEAELADVSPAWHTA